MKRLNPAAQAEVEVLKTEIARNEKLSEDLQSSIRSSGNDVKKLKTHLKSLDVTH